MSGLKLHLVSFDIPYPPDYGGVIDVFYKVKNLAAAGVSIYLHCSQYGNRQPSKALEALCTQVYYYPRKTGLTGISATVPYMVYSRREDKLLHNLNQVDAPIFFDGVSTSYYLNHPGLKNRVKILRPQNVEQDYYRLLAEREKSLFKSMYYRMESRLLQTYESKLGAAQAFFTVARHDYDFFRERYPDATHEYLPSFQPYDEVSSAVGRGDFCLYHGKLSVNENHEAAVFLLKHVIPYTRVPFIIAGKNPGAELIGLARAHTHCSIISNPDDVTMRELIHNAQVHVLPTFQDTGLKLKLLHALFNGRHVLVNKEMVRGTGLAEVCNIADDANDFIKRIEALMQQSVSADMIARRRNLLLQHYDNRANAQRIITFLQQRSL